MKLLFRKGLIPRTTTRQSWKEIWRWKRKTERTLSEMEEKTIAQLRDEELPDKARQAIIDSVINPPVLIYPEK